MISTRTESAVLVTSSGSRYTLDLVDGQVGLNEGSAPYAVTSIRVHRPPLAVLALIDPELKPRVRLTLTSNGSTRVHDLLVDARQVTAGESSVGINLVSDERLVMDYASVATADDRMLWTRQSSGLSIVRSILQKVLGTGYNLVTGVTDAAFPTFSESRNLIPAGSVEYGIGPWEGQAASVAPSTNFHQLGAFSLQVVPLTSSNDSYAFVDPGMQPGKTYTISGYVRVAVAQANTFPGRARGISIMAEDATGQRILASSPQGVNTSDTTTKVSLTFTMPENMLASHVRLYDGAATNGGGAAVYWDAVIMVEGTGSETDNTPMTYWDGDSKSSAYVYSWDGDQGTSASTRSPVIARDPDSLTWSPGQTAWDLLTPILQALGWRLWCDEARVWHVTNNDYALDRVVVIAAGDNLYSHTDLKSRTASQPDGAPLYLDAVMVKYTWTDARGEEQIKYDVYAPSGYTRPYLVELTETPYPGPGAARFLFARYAARRRQINVTARVDYSVTPGMQASITVPEMEAQTGYLDSVSWSLSGDEMTVVTKNLVATPATAWNQLAPGIAWSASPTGALWAAETA